MGTVGSSAARSATGRFRKILVANRGEIAVRIIRACRELGIATVAVYSEADVLAPHVLLADEAVLLGPPEPARSYLHIEGLIEAARRTGAGAVHPGYGFLAENPDFAAACSAASLVFIGPPPEVIRILGDKSQARRLAAQAGVPIIPGVDDPGTAAGAVREAALKLGLPVLLKAAAGGGGKGMRAVWDADHLESEAQAARREASAAFGDATLLIEGLIERPRHVEVQILADAHGHMVHLGERECSIQRRHQKVVEETPSPLVDGAMRAALGEAALRVARAANYVNAGTVEFLVDERRNFYFLEVNTRLQVEHPVTEMVTGIDLVQAQIRLAAGDALELCQEDVTPRGWALECRVYAEDPERGFVPSSGRVLHLHEPRWPGVRVDSGIREGQHIPAHYDPILAKVVAWAPTRPAAIRRMVEALKEYVILGPRTNLAHLRAILEHPAFVAGDLSTQFLTDHLGQWRPADLPPEAWAVAAMLVEQQRTKPEATRKAGAPEISFQDPWAGLRGWRLS
ncbi:MAG TPA: acetyl-CoA carboxylase biotin carboxylase subunit [Clostridiales bacterium UBA8153]|nr:acetyl-CoA carboxylase biotin carboxylase subunit [Clostridiales bacterium UBA8153]